MHSGSSWPGGPTPAEISHVIELYRENLDAYQRDRAAAKAMAMLELTKAPAEIDQAELAAWTVIANVLLNLDETVTKG